MAAGDIGYKTKVGYGTALDGSYTDIAFATEVTPPKITTTRVDITNHDSPSRYKQKRRGMREVGEITVKVLFTKAQQATLITLLEDDTDAVATWWRLKFPLETGEATASNWQCAGFLADLQNMTPLDDKMEADLTIVLTGRPVFTAGT